MLTLADWTLALHRHKIYYNESVMCTWALFSLTFLPARLFNEASSLVAVYGCVYVCLNGATAWGEIMRTSESQTSTSSCEAIISRGLITQATSSVFFLANGLN